MFSSNTDSLCYQSFKGASWALVLGLHLEDTIKGLLLVLGPFLIPFWACVLGLCAYCFKPHQLPPQPLTKRALARAVSLLGLGVIPMWLLRKGLTRALPPSHVL